MFHPTFDVHAIEQPDHIIQTRESFDRLVGCYALSGKQN